MFASALLILERMIQPDQGDLSEEHAKYVLSLAFSPAEQARYAALADKAQQGTLSSEEAEEIDAFISANGLLMILQAKARRSLKHRQPAA